MEPQELPLPAGGDKNGAARVDDSLEVSYKTKHTVPVQSSSRATWHLSEYIEILSLHEILHVDVCGQLSQPKLANSRDDLQ